MYEVEAKVPLKKSDVLRLRKELPKLAKFVKKTVKKDFYFPDFEKTMIRLRMEGKKGVFAMKSKTRRSGVELNEELEWDVADPRAFLRVMKEIGLPLTLKKEKFSEIYRCGKFTIELNRVTGLGHYLEIETMVKSKSAMKGAQKELLSLFARLGFSPNKFENKYYLELLLERKNRPSCS